MISETRIDFFKDVAGNPPSSGIIDVDEGTPVPLECCATPPALARRPLKRIIEAITRKYFREARNSPDVA